MYSFTRLLCKGVIGLVVTLCSFIVTAQDGAVDVTYNPSDFGFGWGEGANGDVNAALVLEDGKLLIAGNFTSVNGVTRNRIARLYQDGTVDLSFDPAAGFNGAVKTMVFDLTQNIVVGGSFSSYKGSSSPYIIRINQAGAIVHTLPAGPTGLTGEVRAIVVQPDGKLLVGGAMTGGIKRIYGSGSNFIHDPGFVVTGTNLPVNAIAYETSSNNIFIGGAFTTYTYSGVTHNRTRIAKIFQGGAPITTWDNTGIGANAEVFSLAMQPGGQLLVGGAFTSIAGTARVGIAQLSASTGANDAAFNPGGGATGGVSPAVKGMKVLSSGNILITGTFTTYDGVSRNKIARITSTGGLDTQFNPGTGPDTDIFSTTLYPDGRIMAMGSFSTYNGVAASKLVRLNPDGSYQQKFDPGTGVSGYSLFAAAQQTDGKYVIGGSFTSYNGVSKIGIARINANGSLDASFPAGSGITGGANTVTHIFIQSDGKILIAGSFSHVDGVARAGFARLNTNGTLDTSFSPALATAPSAIYLQPDGKVLASTGISPGIYRVTSTGATDASFTPGSGASGPLTPSILSIALQSDGKIVIGGSFTSYGGTTRNRVARLNANGTLDTGFDTSVGANHHVYNVGVQNNGKVIVHGIFSSFNGTASWGFCRLLNTGVLDKSTSANLTVTGSISKFVIVPSAD